MNPTINMIIVLEKELDLEHQGMRRTRRYIGDGNLTTDSSWYQASINQGMEARNAVSDAYQLDESSPYKEARRSILSRLFHRTRTRHQSAYSKC
jgi:hypothetical protein